MTIKRKEKLTKTRKSNLKKLKKFKSKKKRLPNLTKNWRDLKHWQRKIKKRLPRKIKKPMSSRKLKSLLILRKRWQLKSQKTQRIKLTKQKNWPNKKQTKLQNWKNNTKQKKLESKSKKLEWKQKLMQLQQPQPNLKQLDNVLSKKKKLDKQKLTNKKWKTSLD